MHLPGEVDAAITCCSCCSLTLPGLGRLTPYELELQLFLGLSTFVLGSQAHGQPGEGGASGHSRRRGPHGRRRPVAAAGAPFFTFALYYMFLRHAQALARSSVFRGS